MTSEGPFQPKPFDDSMIAANTTITKDPVKDESSFCCPLNEHRGTVADSGTL